MSLDLWATDLLSPNTSHFQLQSAFGLYFFHFFILLLCASAYLRSVQLLQWQRLLQCAVCSAVQCSAVLALWLPLRKAATSLAVAKLLDCSGQREGEW